MHQDGSSSAFPSDIATTTVSVRRTVVQRKHWNVMHQASTGHLSVCDTEHVRMISSAGVRPRPLGRRPQRIAATAVDENEGCTPKWLGPSEELLIWCARISRTRARRPVGTWLVRGPDRANARVRKCAPPAPADPPAHGPVRHAYSGPHRAPGNRAHRAAASVRRSAGADPGIFGHRPPGSCDTETGRIQDKAE